MGNSQSRRQCCESVHESVSVSFDLLLPLGALSPESFEYFSLDFLTALYREKAEVHQAGKTGHKQCGIDLEAVFIDGANFTFQCKREAQFGPAKVREAVKAQTIPAKKKYILLSRIASPKAREEIKKARGWDIWDQSDITSKFRTLPKTEQVRIVDTFFPSQRFALTGQMGPGPWLTVKGFFTPQLVKGRIFNQGWELVGRSSELGQLSAAFADHNVVVTSLIGPAGGGKSRVLRSALESFSANHPFVRVAVASPTEVIDAKGLEDLGTGEKLLVVDDAHDRDDLNQLIRYAGDERNTTRLLLVYRPYWVDVIQGELAREGLTGEYVVSVPLEKPTKKNAIELASQVLKEHGASTKLAPMIADMAYDSPLAVVVGAQIVAKEGLHPELLGSNEEFSAAVLKRYEQVITKDIAQGEDRERISAMLRILALIQPVMPDDIHVRGLLSEKEGINAPDASRLARLLIDSGVLFKRGALYRLSPDLLADSIIERACITSSGESNGYAETIFNATIPEHKEHILLNLGRLDWRRNKGDTSASHLLDRIWSNLEWENGYQNSQVKAAASVAYFQPRQALEFAQRLVEEGHGLDEYVCRMIRNAAYNLKFLANACELLWDFGKGDARSMHQHPNHPLRLLTELATPEPGKAIAYCETVVDFGLSLVPYGDSWTEVATPFDVLKGSLATEGHTSEAAKRSVVFTPYGVNPKAVASMRQRVIGMILESLTSSNRRRAFAAAKLLESTVRGPMGIMNHKPSDAAHAAWFQEFADTLSRITAVVEANSLPAIVLVRLGQTVSRFVRYSEESLSEPAKCILARLDRDLETRVIRVLMDGWGQDTWPFEPDDLYHNEQRQEQLAKELEATFPNAVDLVRFLEERLVDLESYHEDLLHSTHIFLDRLIRSQAAVAREIFAVGQRNPESPLAEYVPSALFSLLVHEPSKAHERIHSLLESGDNCLPLIARAYANGIFGARQINGSDKDILRRIFCSEDAAVLKSASWILREVAQKDKRLAIDLIAHGNSTLAQASDGEVFMWLDDDQYIPFDMINEENLECILQLLIIPNNLDNHFVRRFLARVTTRNPGQVFKLAKARLKRATTLNDWTYRSVGIDSEASFNFLELPEGGAMLHEVLDWALLKISDHHFMYQVTDMVVGLFGVASKAFAPALEAWGAGGTSAHFAVLAALLREVPDEFIFSEHTFISRILYVARTIGKDAYMEIFSSLHASALNGVRSGTLGQPFPRDVEMKERAEKLLASMSKTNPAYNLYKALLRSAINNIERSLAKGRAFDEEDADA